MESKMKRLCAKDRVFMALLTMILCFILILVMSAARDITSDTAVTAVVLAAGIAVAAFASAASLAVMVHLKKNLREVYDETADD